MLAKRVGVSVMWVGLLLCLLFTIYRFYLAFFSAPATVGTSADGSAQKMEQGASTRQLVADLQRREIFGSSSPVQPRAKPVVPSKTLPRLAISVVGVLASDEKHSVIVVRHSGLTESLRVGDYLNMPETVFVKAITAKELVLQRANGEMLVTLPERKISDQIVQVSDGAKKIYRVTGQAGRTAFQTYLQDIRQNPQRVKHYLEFQDAHREGALAGKRIAPGKDPRLFTMLPFVPEDMLISVNGSRFDSLEPAQFAEILTSHNRLDFELLREDQHQAIQLVIN